MPIKILALDSSSGTCSLAVKIYDKADSKKLIMKDFSAHHKHAEVVLPLIDMVLQESDLLITDLNAIAVGVGPGSFTGVRLAVSVAKALSFATAVPLVAVSTLAALALGVARKAQNELVLETNLAINIVVINDAKIGEVYFGVYTVKLGKVVTVVADCLCSPSTLPNIPLDILLDPFILTGSAVDLYLALFTEVFSVYSYSIITAKQCEARDIASLGYALYQDGMVTNATSMVPTYLRNKVVNNS